MIRYTLNTLLMLMLFSSCEVNWLTDDNLDFLNGSCWKCSDLKIPIRIYFEEGKVSGIDESNAFYFIPVSENFMKHCQVESVTYVRNYEDNTISNSQGTILILLSDSSHYYLSLDLVNNRTLKVTYTLAHNGSLSYQGYYIFTKEPSY